MRRLLSIFLSFVFLISTLTGCASQKTAVVENSSAQSELTVAAESTLSEEAESVVTASIIDTSSETSEKEFSEDPEIKYTGISDENLLTYIEDTVYSDLVSDLASDEYFVEDISAVYISQEYIDELTYNSKENVFFGYSLSELYSYFEGTRYVFTTGEDGQTIVQPIETIEDTTYNDVIKNVAIGTGVIFVCVTVSVVSAGVGAPAVSAIFAVAAKTGAECALSGAAISGTSAAIVRGIQTGDLSESLKAGAVAASEGFKWGAIGGALSGGASEAFSLYSVTGNGLTMNQVAQIQNETGYPLDVIQQFHSMEEYEVFSEAGLKPHMVNGKLALIRSDIDVNQVDEYGMTNLERMIEGKAPLDSMGKSFELHHIGQKNDGTLAILTTVEHDNSSLHGFVSESEIDRKAFNQTRKEFWKTMAVILQGGE